MAQPAAPEASPASVDAAETPITFSTTATPNSILRRILVVTKNANGDGVEIVVDPNPSDTQADEEMQLNLVFLGCEAKPPYGPFEHTAGLFLDLLGTAIAQVEQRQFSERSKKITIILWVYHTSLGYLPTSDALHESDGIILPGSFNSAYDTDPWIERLKDLIQMDLVANELPTLGICFGHQLYAHSFEKGSAIKCPAGPQAGRKTSQLTEVGQQFLHSSTQHANEDRAKILDLFYTHGDMVETLPPHASAIAGNDNVPVQAATYCSEKSSDKIVAVTFQAHPEYASSRDKGLELTLQNIIDAMQERGDITEQEMETAKQDAVREYERVREQSINATIRAGQALGWFT